MRDRSLVGHTLLAACCIAAAYAAWTHPTITDRDEDAVVLPGNKDDLTAVSWQDADTRVDVARLIGRDGVEKVVEVSVTKLRPPTPPDIFPGSEAARQLLDTIAPLTAARDLGPMDANQRTAYGLDAPTTKLTLRFDKREASVDVGGTTFGSGDYYVQGPGGHAYLMRAATVSSLGHGAVRLQDRDVVGVRRDKFNRMVIAQGTASQTFLQRHPESAGEAFFAEAAEPDRKLDAVGPWVDRLLRLRVVKFADSMPPGAPVFSVTLFWDKAQKATLRMWPVAAVPDGAVLQTPRFRYPVVVSKPTAEALLSELPTLLGAADKAP